MDHSDPGCEIGEIKDRLAKHCAGNQSVLDEVNQKIPFFECWLVVADKNIRFDLHVFLFVRVCVTTDLKHTRD